MKKLCSFLKKTCHRMGNICSALNRLENEIELQITSETHDAIRFPTLQFEMTRARRDSEMMEHAIQDCEDAIEVMVEDCGDCNLKF